MAEHKQVIKGSDLNLNQKSLDLMNKSMTGFGQYLLQNGIHFYMNKKYKRVL